MTRAHNHNTLFLTILLLVGLPRGGGSLRGKPLSGAHQKKDGLFLSGGRLMVKRTISVTVFLVAAFAIHEALHANGGITIFILGILLAAALLALTGKSNEDH